MNIELVTAIQTDIIDTWKTRQDHRLCPTLRTVACCFPEATREEFIKAATLCGVQEATAKIQFMASRHLSCDMGYTLNEDGSLTEVDP